MGKNPHCLSSVLFGFYQISVSFGSGSFQLRKNESSVRDRFFVQSLRFCSIRFYAGSYPYLSSLRVYNLHRIDSVSQKNPPEVLWHFPKRLGIFSPNFTCLLFFLSTLNCKFFIQLSPTVTKSCYIKCDHPPCVSVDGHFEHIKVVALNMA